jgi:hypothetical protein
MTAQIRQYASTRSHRDGLGQEVVSFQVCHDGGAVNVESALRVGRWLRRLLGGCVLTAEAVDGLFCDVSSPCTPLSTRMGVNLVRRVSVGHRWLDPKEGKTMKNKNREIDDELYGLRVVDSLTWREVGSRVGLSHEGARKRFHSTIGRGITDDDREFYRAEETAKLTRSSSSTHRPCEPLRLRERHVLCWPASKG